MVRAPGWTGLIALLMCLGGCAASVPQEIDASSIRPLIEFVERETGTKIDPLPLIATVSSDQLASPQRGALAAQRSAAARYNTLKVRQENGGFKLSGVIRIADRFSLNDVDRASTLVHELVHHAQAIAIVTAYVAGGDAAFQELSARRGWVCLNSLEREAYSIQNAWLLTRAPQYTRRESQIADLSQCREGDIGILEFLSQSPYAD